MRAGFEVYRAFLKDAEDLRANVKEHGKSSVATLATGGEHSRFTPFIAEQARDFANGVTHRKIPHSTTGTRTTGALRRIQRDSWVMYMAS